MHRSYTLYLLWMIVICCLSTSYVHSQFLERTAFLNEQSGSQFSEIEQYNILSNSNILIAGSFSGSLDLNPGSQSNIFSSPSGSAANLFFARYSFDYELVWGRQIWAVDEIYFGGISNMLHGGYLLAGSFNDTIDLNPNANQALYTPLNSGAEDGFFVKYGNTGQFNWARQISGSRYVRITDSEVDNNVIYLAGTFEGSADFNPSSSTALKSANDADLFIAKYDASGNYINAINVGVSSGFGRQEVKKLLVYNGDLYLAGIFEGSVDFDPSTSTNLLTSVGKNDFFLAKYNSSLQLDWVYQIGGPGEEGNIDLDIKGNKIWLAGSFKDSIDVDLQTTHQILNSNGDFDVFLARYDMSGNHQMSFSIGGTAEDELSDLNLVHADTAFIAGQFSGTVDFDPGTEVKALTSSSNLSIYFASYDVQGNYRLASQISGTGDVKSSIVNPTSGHRFDVCGNLKGTSDFNAKSTFTENRSGPASFIARYGRCDKAQISVITNDAQCNTRSGSAEASVLGGTAPFQFFWTSGHRDSIADSLRAGLYFLTVSDTNMCTYQSDPVIINDVNGPSVSVSSSTDPSCPNGSDGNIVINASGGTSPYSYSWSNGSSNKNLSGLKSGNYEITVTDNAGCKAHNRISLSQPAAFSVNSTVSESTCGNSDGAISVLVNGGSPTYSYSWNPGGAGSSLVGIASGIYKLTVTDSKNCEHVEDIIVNDENGPRVLLDSVREGSCGKGGGDIFVNVSGGMPLYSYSWSPNSSTSQDLLNAGPGTHQLEVTDANSCKGFFSQELRIQKPTSPEICLVDVEPKSGLATVVWEKGSKGSAEYYNIYRETTTLNIFDLVEDSIPYDSLSLFTDSYANTWIRPWSYKITMTDTCGVESEKGAYHTTIHTVITKTPSQDFNVLWTPYKGDFVPAQYTCYRYTDSTGTLDSITTVPGNIFTYTDLNSPSKGGDVYYVIEARHPDGCTATKGPNRNSSRSNRGSISEPDFDTTTSVGRFNEKTINQLLVYPNPSESRFNLEIKSERNSQSHLKIFDSQSRIVFSEDFIIQKGDNKHELDLSLFNDGLYLLVIESDDNFWQSRLMKSSR